MRSEFRVIFGLAWPTSLGMLAFMAMNVVDSICVGQLGGSAQAGVAVANAWGLSGAVLAMGAVRAIEPVVSQAYGEGDRTVVGQALTRMLALSVPLGLLVSVWYLLTPWGLRLLGQPESVIPYAQAYAAPLAFAWPIVMLSQTLRTFLQAIGTVRPAMVPVMMTLPFPSRLSAKLTGMLPPLVNHEPAARPVALNFSPPL